MKAYVLATLEIFDRETYARYEAGFGAIFERYSGTILAVDEAPEPLEEEWSHTRTVLIEFPDKTAARAWYESPDYQALMQHRIEASRGSVVLLDGLT